MVVVAYREHDKYGGTMIKAYCVSIFHEQKKFKNIDRG